ncbi:hypothetical protein FW774_16860 [Pedobacter sp. BS3]|uniref:hypothetical protein n=1 Tax=Pedobacter sp. BS3 TaxID=2567937 RepID=UPI0011EDD545|nr:hypothetical protein [Pedobacter sp. BS3]TZF81726.1 hypothetical protein FW774_16860 [Pedobacter sp. BS3]
MKRIFFSLVATALTLSGYLYAQVPANNALLASLLNKARQEHKPVLLMFDVPVMASNEQSRKILSVFHDKSVQQVLISEFIYQRLTWNNAETSKLAAHYKIYTLPCFLYLDTNGTPIYRTTGYSSSAQRYVAAANYALNIWESGKNLSAYDSLYRKGDRSRTFLKTYITERKRLGYLDNANLIEEYVKQLKIDDLNSFDEVVFILEAGPAIDSSAYKLATLNRKLKDSIYKSLPSVSRTNINSRIITNSMAKAIATCNIRLAYQIASFAKGAYGKNLEAGRGAGQSQLLAYFKGTKDTANFLARGVDFVSRYYLNISLDSAKRFHQRELDSAKAARKKIQASVSDTANRTLVYSPSRITTPTGYASKLNNIAWDFYQTGTTNPVYLNKALSWVERAIAINPSPAYYDTQAHLYYRLQLYTKAEVAQKIAIRTAKKKLLPKEYVTRFSNELAKMKSRTL